MWADIKDIWASGSSGRSVISVWFRPAALFALVLMTPLFDLMRDANSHILWFEQGWNSFDNLSWIQQPAPHYCRHHHQPHRLTPVGYVLSYSYKPPKKTWCSSSQMRHGHKYYIVNHRKRSFLRTSLNKRPIHPVAFSSQHFPFIFEESWLATTFARACPGCEVEFGSTLVVTTFSVTL